LARWSALLEMGSFYLAGFRVISVRFDVGQRDGSGRHVSFSELDS